MRLGEVKLRDLSNNIVSASNSFISKFTKIKENIKIHLGYRLHRNSKPLFYSLSCQTLSEGDRK